MAAVLEKAGLSALTRNFVGVVCHNRRLFMLPQMTGAYLAKLAERRGEVTADAISAAPLTEQQTAALADSVRRLVGGSVTLDVEVDCSLLGGLIVKVGSRMFDSSLKTKLQRMKLAMKGIG